MKDKDWWQSILRQQKESWSKAKVFREGKAEVWFFTKDNGIVDVAVKSDEGADICISGFDHIYTSVGEL